MLSLSGDATPVTLPTVDGSETVINNGTNTTVNGSGTTADPYTIDVPSNTDSQDLSISGDALSLSGDPTATPIDLSGYTNDDTNELITSFGVNGTDLRITEAGINFDVPLSSLGTDNQTASEVNLDTPVDMDEGGEPSPTSETTVEAALQAIAPITSKAARIFYPPSIAVNASTNVTGAQLNLYAQYTAQYGSPAVASAGAPAAIPTYGPTELYYYVTYADPLVFSNMSIDANGVLTYDIIGQPTDYNALINVVFVVKK